MHVCNKPLIKVVYEVTKSLLYLINKSFSNLELASLFLLDVRTKFPWLKGLSTGALEGMVILYFKNIF